MADQEWEKLSDKELVRNAFSGEGERFAEMMRRLRVSNDKVARVNFWLTVALLIFAALQLFVTIIQLRVH